MSLFFIVPLFAVTGTVAFKDPGDNTKVVTWARQGGAITLEVTDSDLNLPVKRVLVPSDFGSTTPGALFGTGTTTKGLKTIIATTSGISSISKRFSVGDTILVGSSTSATIETVRLITAIATGTPSGFDTITVSTAFTNAQANVPLVEVTTAATLFAKCPLCAHAQLVRPDAGAGTRFIVLNSIPVVDSGTGADFANRVSGSKDTIVNTSDIRFSTNVGGAATHDSSTAITSFDGNSGLVTFTQAAVIDKANYYMIYWGARVDTSGTAVKVISQADPSGVVVTLTETGSTTGVFRVDLGLHATTTKDNSTSTATLKVGKDDVVTLTYTDASQTANPAKAISVETTKPSFTNMSPANNTSGQASRPEVQADVTDAQSGIVTTSVKVVFALDTNADGKIDDSAEVDVTTDGDLTTITNGRQAKQRLPSELTPRGDATLWWWVKSDDLAGNVGITDRLPTAGATPDLFPCDTDNFPTAANLIGLDPTTGTSTNVGFCAPRAIRIDFTAPSITTATITGQFWDTTLITTNKMQTDVKKASNTSVRAVFNEDLDCTTVAASDFEVDDVVPSLAECFSAAKSSVFLTVATLSPDARPKVEIVGSVSDVAGNAKTTGTINLAVDGIAPGLTVTPSDRPVTKGSITIQVVADEDVSTPVVQVRKVGSGCSGGECSGNTLATSTVNNVTMTFKSGRTYEGTFTAASDGLYNIFASAKDATAANSGDKGLDAIATNDQDTTENGVQIKLASAILFEKDSVVETPSIGPATTDNPNTFITIDFTNEGKEYGLDTNGLLTAVPADVVTSYDTKGTTSITSITLDGTDISGSISTADNKQFLYKATGLSVAAHTIKVKAKDIAGTETEFTVTVTVTLRKAFELKLNPGSNLVSIPSAASSSAINDVISSTHPATSVRSYDPSVPGFWLTAVRAADGLFTGTLTTIDSTRGYWITTNSFESINVDIPALAAGMATTPPTVAVSIGWNLLPVLDITGTPKAGDTIAASQYFAGLTLTRVFTFDTVGNVWDEINIAAGGDNVVVGSAYWAFATKTGTLVPGAE